MGDPERKILVIGGGISGITAALEAAEAGAEVSHRRKESLSGRSRGASQPIFSQTVSSDLRS